jgi:hypothetical protein
LLSHGPDRRPDLLHLPSAHIQPCELDIGNMPDVQKTTVKSEIGPSRVPAGRLILHGSPQDLVGQLAEGLLSPMLFLRDQVDEVARIHTGLDCLQSLNGQGRHRADP